ncbi:MAG: DNA replication and repair protein RecF [Polyangiaceae bacterium]|jgi:DNA replication and repair protein RecF
MRALAVRSLGVRGFRNLTRVDIDLGARFNVVSGENGQGKTNLLESVYVVATSRSFRTSMLTDLISLGSEVASLRASIDEDRQLREQTVGLRAGVRAVRIDGRRPPTLAAYAVRTPTVVFHPGAVALVAGAGGERRKLLDRVALYLLPGSMGDSKSYAKALRARQRVLESRGESASDLDGWEDLLVRHGFALMAARSIAADRLLPATLAAFTRIGAPGLQLAARYACSCPDTPEQYRESLLRQRARDRARGFASTGPHRDDLALTLGDHPVRGMASQGQQRAVVLALQLGEISVISAVSGTRPILLMDDVSSELDRRTTVRLFDILREEPGQILLTTTRPEVIDAAGLLAGEARVDFVVLAGQITRR